jgi:hypothetical protein
MSRRFVVVAWITVTTIPVLAAAVFCFACCVLPFHDAIHDLMPGCELAARLNRPDVDDQKAQQPFTAPENQKPTKRPATVLSSGFRTPELSHEQRLFFASPLQHYRSFITLGAIRCDQDVGLHVLVKTFLI